MTEYMELIEGDEVMRDVRKRRAEASVEFLRFKGDMEGFRRHEEAEMEKLGFRYEPTGHGTTRLVRITG